MKPGIFDTNAGDYYADAIGKEPTLNATVAKLILSASPRHAWQAHPKLNPNYAPTVDKKFDIGSAAHEIFLLGNDHAVHVVDATDWRSKAAQEVRARARSEGLVALLRHEWVRVSEMLAAIREQIPALDCDPPLFVDGKAEQTLIWKDRGVWCRARMDYVHDTLLAVDDMKTASGSASPLVWANRTMWGFGAHIQACMTIRGLHAITGNTAEFRFLAVETHPPYAIQPVRLGPGALELGNRLVDRALDKWKDCLDRGEWPSYTPRIVDADPPGWLENDLWAAELLDEVAA